MKSLTQRILDMLDDYAGEHMNVIVKESVMYLKEKIEEMIDEADFDEIALIMCEHFVKHNYRYHGRYKALIADDYYELLDTVISKSKNEI